MGVAKMGAAKMTRNDDQERARDRDLETPEDRLAGLLAEYMDRLNAGEALDEQQIVREQPELAADLIGDFRTLRQLSSESGTCARLGTLGDYTLRRQIGRGGMGVVYEAWQGSLDRQVALKVLPAGVAADNKAFVRFMREDGEDGGGEDGGGEDDA